LIIVSVNEVLLIKVDTTKGSLSINSSKLS